MATTTTRRQASSSRRSRRRILMVQTPAKLSWKFPKPLGILGFSIDKFEMDKKGAMKLETSASKELHKIADLKVEGKSNITDIGSISAGLAYTGLKDTQIKCETKIQN